MNRLLAGMLGLMMSFAVSAQEITCDDLADMADAMDELVAVLESGVTVTEGDATDQALGTLVDNLLIVAQVEGASDLTDYVHTMDAGWDDLDGESFMYGANGVIDALDRLYIRDCE